MRIALFGGSFNPPGKHHTEMARELTRHFNRVVVVPCGPRGDKATVSHIDPVHRAAMADLAFGKIPGVEVDLSDLERGDFTRAFDLEQRLATNGDEIWHVVGSDLLIGGARSSSEIHRWHRGDELWENSRFAAFTRHGYPLDIADLPPRNQMLATIAGASTDIRSNLLQDFSISDLVDGCVETYIQRHRLYVPHPLSTPPQKALFTSPKFLIVADEKNAEAQRQAGLLSHLVDESNPDIILTLGGDGTMLRAIQTHWRRRVPFLGVNFGRLGFLLNELPRPLADKHFAQTLIIRHSPLLHAEVENTRGEITAGLAFNDARLERVEPQSAWIEVSVNGMVQLPHVVCDGMLVATPAGSTAYARAMGQTPLEVGSPSLLLVGSNVAAPMTWRAAHLPLDARVEMRNLDPTPGHTKRPLRAVLDSEVVDDAAHLTVRRSRIAAAELLFLPPQDLAFKLLRLQFPLTGEGG